MEQINVEEIMAQIRQEIKDKGYTPDMLSFKDVNAIYSMDVEYEYEDFVNTVGSIQTIKSISWRRNDIGGGIKGTVKRAIMKLIGFVVDYHVSSQNIYNDRVAYAFTQLQSYIDKQGKLIDDYQKKLDELSERIKKNGE